MVAEGLPVEKTLDLKSNVEQLTKAGEETVYTLATGSSSGGTYTFYLNRCVSNGGGNNSYENGCTVMTAMEITPGSYAS